MSRYDSINIEKGFDGGVDIPNYHTSEGLTMECTIERRFLHVYERNGWRVKARPLSEYEEWGYYNHYLSSLDMICVLSLMEKWEKRDGFTSLLVMEIELSSLYSQLSEIEQIAFGDDLMSQSEDIMCYAENGEGWISLLWKEVE